MAAPTLTPYADMAPGPRVLVQYASTAFVAGTERVTVLANEMPVPGMTNVSALGGLVKTDSRAPVNVPISYRAQMFDVTGASLGFTETATTQINTVKSYLSSPVTPSLCTEIELSAEAGSSINRPVNGKRHNIGGRMILLATDDDGITALNMSFTTVTQEQTDIAMAIFADANGMVLFRTPPPMMIPRVFYAWGSPNVEEVNLPGGIEEVDFRLTVDEIEPPTPEIVSAVLTYRRYRAAFATNRQFRNAYPTFRAALLNPPPSEG